MLFTYRAKDGEEGYPGNLTVRAEYSWNDLCELGLHITAETDAPTLANFTNHAYFNLGGENSGSVLGHELQLNAHLFLPTSDSLIPTGDLLSVKDTPMDFSSPHVLGADIKADFPALVYGKGYDNCWLLDGFNAGSLRRAATRAADVCLKWRPHSPECRSTPATGLPDLP